MMVEEINSKKSRTIYTVSGNVERTFLTVSGEMATNSKVLAEVARIRRSGASWSEAVWTARMLANTY